MVPFTRHERCFIEGTGRTFDVSHHPHQCPQQAAILSTQGEEEKNTTSLTLERLKVWPFPSYGATQASAWTLFYDFLALTTNAGH